MTGTSLDGVDGALCGFSAQGAWQGVLRHVHRPFDTMLREQLAALQHSGADEAHRAALAGNALARAYAQVVEALLAGASPRTVRAIGAHGQTIRHRPGQYDGTGYTLQINQPALLAELCGIDVVADFRSRDVAAGGQGAPLVPPFHAAVFGRDGQPRCVVNIGGIGNITLLGGHGPLRGFDCGPGNALLDHWVQQHLGEPFDRDGAWSAGGMVQASLLQQMLAEPFFGLPPPKSTGRDLFHAGWLAEQLATCGQPFEARDVQATLCELTAQAIADPVRQHQPGCTELIVCGGGALNADLMRRLARLLPDAQVVDSGARGLPPLQVEAAAFAWLARQHLERQPGNHPGVTGAAGTRILGACWPA